METQTIVADTYEQALLKARELFGSRMRVLKRRDFATSGFLGLGKKKQCEITVYEARKKPRRAKETPSEIAGGQSEGESDEEALNYSEFCEEEDSKKDQIVAERAPEKPLPEDEESRKALAPYLRKLKKIMALNDFSDDYADYLAQEVKNQLLKALPNVPSSRDFEMLLLDNIVSSFESDHSTQLYPPQFFVLVGSSGVGKTATAAKIGNLFSSGLGKSVEVVLLQNQKSPFSSEAKADPNGVFCSFHSYDEDLLQIAPSPKKDIYIIDSFSFSLTDAESRNSLLKFFRCLPKDDTKYFLVMDASMKGRDLAKLFSVFENIAFQSIVLTKCDETETIGNVISVCNRFGLPLLFITDGKDLMSNIHFASSFAVLSKLKGFSLDMERLVRPD